MNEVNTGRVKELEAELEELRMQLFEAQESIEAIRTGQVDALVVEGEEGPQLYALRTADRAYRVFIEKMNEGAVTLNTSGIIIYCNSQFASMVNLPLSQVIGSPFSNFIAAEDNEAYNDLFQKCWGVACKEEVSLEGGAKKIPIQLSLTALEYEEGTAMSIILTDLSMQKQAQQQLENTNRLLALMNQALEHSNNDLQQFASVASHDLQEPIRKIHLFSNLLQKRLDGQVSTDAKYFLDKIIGSAGRMKNLITDVLNYSKLSAGNDQYEPVDFNLLLNELLEDFDLSIQERAALIEVGPLPTIRCNRGQMRQVFQNIISNALKFAKPDVAPIIQISSRRVGTGGFDGIEQADGQWHIISIKDNGIGFEEKYLGHIFALFERLHSKESYDGTGIGLAIAKKILEKHDGLITARSIPGDGAEFLLLLPAGVHSHSTTVPSN